jgi:hypothetical protein
MKTLIIEISDEFYNRVAGAPRCASFSSDLADRNELVKAIQSGTLISDTTNEDVLRKVFPDFEEDITPKDDTLILERYTPYCKMQLHKDWLSAPYKRR